MRENLPFLIIIWIIISLVALIAVFFAGSVLRRIFNEWKYRKLDGLRSRYLLAVRQHLNSEGQEELPRPKPGSLAWKALETVLLNLAGETHTGEQVIPLFPAMGYIAYHENRLLQKGNRLRRASSIDTLGRMRSASSVPKLVPLLDDPDSETVTVTVRALSRIGSEAGLRAVMDRLPRMLESSVVTRKALENSLLNFGEIAIPHLVQFHRLPSVDPWVISCVLETLSHFPPDQRSARFAKDHLTSGNAEVRSKALKVLGRSAAGLAGEIEVQILPLLEDAVWFVRIQAVKTVEALALQKGFPLLGRLLSDPNWHVRDAAAVALAKFPDVALEIFLNALKGTDVYAKESICEELERTGFCSRLLNNLIGQDHSIARKSAEILAIMHGLHFSSPHEEYLKTGEDARIKKELSRFVTAGGQ